MQEELEAAQVRRARQLARELEAEVAVLLQVLLECFETLRLEISYEEYDTYWHRSQLDFWLLPLLSASLPRPVAPTKLASCR